MEPWQLDLIKIMVERCVRAPGDRRPTTPHTALNEIMARVEQELTERVAAIPPCCRHRAEKGQ